jgi:hypothetical protein
MPTRDFTVQVHFQEKCSSGSLPRQQSQIESDIISEAFKEEDHRRTPLEESGSSSNNSSQRRKWNPYHRDSFLALRIRAVSLWTRLHQFCSWSTGSTGREKEDYRDAHEYNTFLRKLMAYSYTTNQEGSMPSAQRMRRDGREDLVFLMQKHGGQKVLAARLGLRVRVELTEYKMIVK